jgi:DNA repair protein RecO (recombination protein O)
VSGRQRVDGAAAYLLHAYPYSESSLILDVFSREHGRVPILARGARRPRSAVRGSLMAFQPLELGWFGGGEVKTLAKAEWVGGVPLLKGRCLLLGYYLNELLVGLLPREDAHARLFDVYAAALAALAHGVDDAPELRRFELELLRELGYGVRLDVDAESGGAVVADVAYVFVFERGPVPASGNEPGSVLSGKTLCDMAADDYTDPRTRFESKVLMRQLIAHYLGGRPLQSRRIFMDLQEL